MKGNLQTIQSIYIPCSNGYMSGWCFKMNPHKQYEYKPSGLPLACKELNGSDDAVH